MKDEEHLQIFIEEANALLEDINNHLEKWQVNFDPPQLAAILRELHTLKGNARMLGFMPLSEHVHALEQIIQKIHEEKFIPHQDRLNEIQHAIDYIIFYIDSLSKSVPVETFAINQLQHSGSNTEIIRIKSEMLEKFSLLATEVNVSRAPLSQKISKTRETASEITKEIQLLQEQIRNLQLKAEASGDISQDDAFWQQSSRSLINKLNYLEQLSVIVSNSARGSEGLLRQQARAGRSLEEEITHARTISLASLVPRLSRIVRQVSHELNKEVKFNFLKVHGEVDRKMMEKLIPGLEHMVRNAIDHGIESSIERIQKGKKAQGTITLSMYRQNNELIIELKDDGQGIDISKVKARAIEKNLWDSGSMSTKEAIQMILLPGFSTKEVVSPISGRGLGMDVVNSEISKLGGTLHISTKSNRGVTFTIHLPCGLSLNQALIILLNKQTWAIPLEHLMGITRLTVSEIKKKIAQDKALIQYAHKTYHFMYLGELLGSKTFPEVSSSKALPVILLQSPVACFAFVIDKLIASREILIKPAGLQLQFVNVIAGFSVLGEGQIAFVLNVKDLIERAIAKMQQPMSIKKSADLVKMSRTHQQLKVLIVDDSTTVRKIVSRFLKRHDYQPYTAFDGLNAFEVMATVLPDIVLLDIEMPRMDGYQIISQMKKDPRYKNIPVIMITSRSNQKYYLRAMEVGADGYLVKPFLEEALLTLLNKYKPQGE